MSSPRRRGSIFSAKIEKVVHILKHRQDFLKLNTKQITELIVLPSFGMFGEEEIRTCPKLSVICTPTLSVDHINVLASTKHSVAVLNSPTRSAKKTAGRVLKIALSSKESTQKNQNLFGIIGFGTTGEYVAHAAQRAGFRVLVCEPYTIIPPGIEQVTLAELLQQSNIISIHVPFTYLTHRIINKATLKLCKRGTVLINASRGDIVDMEAVKEAVATNRIEYFTTAHVEKQTKAVSNEPATSAFLELKRGIHKISKGEIPKNCVNPQVLHKTALRVELAVFENGFSTVLFDCDSTLSKIEGIDELAKRVGKEQEISELTKNAMEGKASFEEVFEKRLTIIKPKRNDLTQVGRQYVSEMVMHALPVISALHLLGITVYVVSGGFSIAVREVTRALGIPDNNVFANELLFDENGNFTDFVRGPLIRNNGKLQIIRQLKRGTKLFLGDGKTDIECSNAVDFFVGYGGVVQRRLVEAESSVFLKDESLAPLLVLSAGVSGCKQLLNSKYRRFVGTGLDILFNPRLTTIKPNYSFLRTTFHDVLLSR